MGSHGEIQTYSMAKSEMNDEIETLFLDDDRGSERRVGRLRPPAPLSSLSSSDGGKATSKEEEEERGYYIFISHTGQDGVKEDIARPTHWFLTRVWQIRTFLDDGETRWGERVDTAIAGPAHECTHALVLFSPAFRKRKYCVMELNTFMYRLLLQRREEGASFQVLPALWLLDNLRGYPESVQEIIRIQHKTNDPADYMLLTLWPRLLKALGLREMQERELEFYFLNYVEDSSRGPRPPPQGFKDRIRAWKDRLLLPTELTAKCQKDNTLDDDESTAASSSSPDQMVIGICFSNVYMDKNVTWNKQVLACQDSIEHQLEKLATYHKVMYGRTTIETKRSFSCFGTVALRLDCEIVLRDDLNDIERYQVKKAAESLAQLLRDAGTTEEDLDRIMIGGLWKGSFCLLLEAPESIFETLHDMLLRSSERYCPLDLGAGFALIDMIPAFSFRAAAKDPTLVQDRSSKVDKVVFRTLDTLDVLYPTTLLATGQLFFGGLPFQHWPCMDDEKYWDMLPIAQVETRLHNRSHPGSAVDDVVRKQRNAEMEEQERRPKIEIQASAAAGAAEAQLQQHHRPWDGLGPPSDPIPFPQPQWMRGRRDEVLCHNPATGERRVFENVLLRDFSRDHGSPGEAETVRFAYWKVPDVKPIQTFDGHVEICQVFERLRNDDDSSSSCDEDDDEEIVFQWTDRRVAVKVKYAHRMDQLRKTVDPLQEIAVRQLLGADPVHVLGAMEVLADGQNFYVVMRYCDGGDLFQLLFESRGRDGGDGKPVMSEGECRYWFRQVMTGVAFLHAKGICHRDLSPENIMIDGNKALIIGMGSCLRVPYLDPNGNNNNGDEQQQEQRRVHVEDSRGETTRCLFRPNMRGKMPYMCPEMFANRPFDGAAADVWTSGTILFCMVTGNGSYQRPHVSDRQFSLMSQGLRQLLSHWNIVVSEECIQLLEGMLQIDPRLRLTIDEVRNHPWFDYPDEAPMHLKEDLAPQQDAQDDGCESFRHSIRASD